jgi:hypothetical protein
MMEKSGNWIFPLKPGFSIGYGIGPKVSGNLGFSIGPKPTISDVNLTLGQTMLV